MDNEWKHSLRDRMEDYAEPAPEGLWKAISESSEFAGLVSGLRVSAGKPAIRRDNRIWFAIAGGIAAVFALSLLLWHPDGSGVKGTGPDLFALVEPVDTEIDVNPFGRNVPALASLQERSADVPATPDMTVAVSNMAEGGLDMTEKSGKVAEDGSGMGEDGLHRDWNDAVEVVGAGKRRGRWSAGLLASNIPVSSSSSHAGETEVMVRQASSDFVTNSLADIRTFNTTRETNTSYRHYQPITVGLSVRYYFSRSWSAESGLTYSCLYSKVRSGSDDYYTDGSRTLHYIGIPLNINANIWSNRSLTLYASAGGKMEKCVGGQFRSTSYFNGAKGDTSYEKAIVKPVQWSVSASLGLQYNLSYLIGIYIEPGAAYYFNNGSTTETFYSAHPLNFNLELGFRFSF